MMGDSSVPQLPFDFGAAPSHADEDFLVAASNEDARAWIRRWPDWPRPALAVYGPPGCGKTHLGQIWRRRAAAAQLAGAGLTEIDPPAILARASALLIDDLTPANLTSAAERHLLHLYNLLAERKGHLLLCAVEPPARWPIQLADLRSRLNALPAVAIQQPDDGLLRLLLAKLFSDRQLTVDADTVEFALRRIERSFEAARRLAEAVDRAALTAQRKPTIALMREVLQALDGPD